MHTVVETPVFIRSARKAGVTEEELDHIKNLPRADAGGRRRDAGKRVVPGRYALPPKGKAKERRVSGDYLFTVA